MSGPGLQFTLSSADESSIARLIADLVRQAVNDAVSPYNARGGVDSRKEAAVKLKAKERQEAWEFFSSARFAQLCGWVQADTSNAAQLARGEIRRRRAERASR